MFRWYELATVFYAYLFDVHVFDVHSESNALEFHSSSWFTRAWTLQELLAPRHVVFLSSHWKDLGTKPELSELVLEVTRID